MKSPVARFPVRTGAVLGFLAMAVVGWNLADAPVPGGKDPAASEGKNQRAKRGVRKSTGPDAAARQRLAAVRTAGSPEERLAATVALANSLTPSEMAAWLGGGWFDIKGGPERLIFRNFLLARLSETDPEAALAMSLQNGVKVDPILIASLAEKEPERLIDFFKKHPDQAAELEALRAIAANHPTLALQRLQEMVEAGMRLDGSNKSFKVLLQLAASSPAALEAALGSLPLSMRTPAETALCEQKLLTGFSTEVRALWDRPGGWMMFKSILRENQELRGKLLIELPNLPAIWREEITGDSYSLIRRGDTGKWLDADLEGQGFSARQAGQIRENALSLMVWYNAEEALSRVKGMEMDSGRRQELMGRIFESLGKNPEKAEALIARMSSPEEREQARKSVAAGKAQMLARFGEATDIQTANPQEWLERIGGIDPQDSASYAPYLHQMEQWAPDKLAELSQQFSSLPDASKPQVARLLMAGATPVTGDAIRYLIDNPGTGLDGTAINPVRMASEYASRLAYRDPASASQWVATLPAGEARLWAQKNVAKNWAVYDPQAAGQWVASLPADARGEVRAFMEKEK